MAKKQEEKPKPEEQEEDMKLPKHLEMFKQFKEKLESAEQMDFKTFLKSLKDSA